MKLKINLIRTYIFILIFGLFALNVGQTFSANNFPFLGILFIGAVLTIIILLARANKVLLDKSLFLYLFFVIYSGLSRFWAIDIEKAQTGFYVVLLTLVVIIIFYFVLRESRLDITTLCKYICIASFATYLYIIFRYGISATWDIRDETFIGVDLYNANSVGKVYCLGTICGFKYFYDTGKSDKIILLLSIILSSLMILCGSKTNLLFLIFYYIISLYLKQREISRKAIIILLIPLLIYGIYLAFMYIPALYLSVGYRFNEVFDFFNGDLAKYSSTWYRFSMYQNGWNAFIKNPLFGYGMANSSFYNKFEYVYQSGVYLHSNYLELMVDLGLIGTFIYYSIYVYVLRLNIKKYKLGDTTSRMFVSLLCAFLISDISSISYLSRPSVIIIFIAAFYGRNRLSRNER